MTFEDLFLADLVIPKLCLIVIGKVFIYMCVAKKFVDEIQDCQYFPHKGKKGEHNLHYAICTNAILIQFVLCNFIYTACTNANHVICTSIFNSYNLH